MRLSTLGATVSTVEDEVTINMIDQMSFRVSTWAQKLCSLVGQP